MLETGFLGVLANLQKTAEGNFIPEFLAAIEDETTALKAPSETKDVETRSGGACIDDNPEPKPSVGEETGEWTPQGVEKPTSKEPADNGPDL